MRNATVKYWIIVASKDHVRKGITAGIAQACHGKATPLKRMRKGDYIVYYSGKQVFGQMDKCQEFTAIGKVKDEDIFPFQMTENFCPFRRKIDFFESEDVSIIPLIDKLTFIGNKAKWGAPLRFGFLEIPEKDFKLISSKMCHKSDVQ